MIETIFASAAIALGSFVGVTRPGTLPAAAAAAAMNDSKQPVIVHIVSRDQTVTVKAGKSGLLYSLTSTSGRVMIADATPEKFSQLQPELYRNLRQYVAVKNDDAPMPTAIATIGD